MHIMWIDLGQLVRVSQRTANGAAKHHNWIARVGFS